MDPETYLALHFILTNIVLPITMLGFILCIASELPTLYRQKSSFEDEEEVWEENPLLSRTLAERRREVLLSDLEESHMEIGQGSQSTIKHGRYRKEQVAIKHFKPELLRVDNAIKREVLFLSALTHPNIVKFHGVVARMGGVCGLVLEFIEGGPLSQNLGRIENNDINFERIYRGTASALNYIHAHCIVHRDINPENILLDKRGHPHLADFGLAGAFGPGDRYANGKFGCKTYMAPEVSRYATHYPSSDMYSYGMVFNLAGSYQEESKRSPTFFQLIERCHLSQPEARPSAREFLKI